MQIEIIENENKGAFQAIDNGTIAGEMTFSKAGSGKIIIDHTEVNAQYNGKGIGKQLLMRAVEYARSNHLQVIPLCPFARSVFNKIPEIRDVLN